MNQIVLSLRAPRYPLSMFAALVCASVRVAAQPSLPPVDFPVENPFSVEKSMLGKALFWDAQLSSDNTMSCGTCHIPSSSGTDPRTGINPGVDGIFGNANDIIGSPGVSSVNQDDHYLMSVLYGLLPQITGRQAQPAIMAMYAPQLFWDGRASGQFVDPLSGEVVIDSGGALESQALGPIISDVEMAHQGRDWDAVVTKLYTVRPLALASALPEDLLLALGDGNRYPQLFVSAFGDDEITPVRIAMAIATYERTLLPDQTPYDAFVGGDLGALSPQQLNGFNALSASRCGVCHTGAAFTGDTFRNIGLRPVADDTGRMQVTNNPVDRGRFKVPSLRNVGLRDRFMHNGQLATIGEVFDFYASRNGQVSFPQNRDPLLNTPIVFPVPVQNDIINFLVNGLTDPRVATESFPFDRPTLLSESVISNPLILDGGVAGAGGLLLRMIALSPPILGNADFKVGIEGALGGATAWVAVSLSPPLDGLLDQSQLLGPITLSGTGAGDGFGTMHQAIPDALSMDGQVVYWQWLVADPSAPAGLAASEVAQLTYFCSLNGICTSSCPADFSGDGKLDFFDVSAFLSAYGTSQPIADINADGVINFFDVSAFLSAYNAGCP